MPCDSEPSYVGAVWPLIKVAGEAFHRDLIQNKDQDEVKILPVLSM